MIDPALKPFLNSLETYFKKQGIHDQKVALALSGGPDSMALYHFLLLLKKDFIVLHVNHNMRKASRDEALKIKEWCDKDNVPFFSYEITDFDFSQGNIEDRLRNLRYTFFFQKLHDLNITHLFLGHQQDDVEEIVLKRILEGSSIFKMATFFKPKTRHQVTLHRPLIEHPKKKLLSCLKWLNRDYFNDETNKDTKFLRARMRENILPYLQQQFQKSISGKFYQLGLELNEVDHYLKKQTKAYIRQSSSYSWGYFLPKLQLHPLELKYVLLHFLDKLQENATKQEMASLIHLYNQTVSNKKIILRHSLVAVDKRGFYFIKDKNQKFEVISLSDALEGTLEECLDGKPVKIAINQLPFFLKNALKSSSGSSVCFKWLNLIDSSLNG